MIRLILWNLFLFSLPFLMSWVWTVWVRRRNPDFQTRRNYALLTALGTALVLGGLLVWRFSSGDDPGTNYVPPQLKDGKVVPGRFE